MPAKKAGGLPVDLPLSFHSPRSNLRLSAPEFQQTLCGDHASLTSSVLSRCNKTILVEHCSTLSCGSPQVHNLTTLLSVSSQDQKHILPGTPAATTIRSKENSLPGNTQPSQSPKLHRGNRNQETKHLPNKDNSRNQHVGL